MGDRDEGVVTSGATHWNVDCGYAGPSKCPLPYAKAHSSEFRVFWLAPTASLIYGGKTFPLTSRDCKAPRQNWSISCKNVRRTANTLVRYWVNRKDLAAGNSFLAARAHIHLSTRSGHTAWLRRLVTVVLWGDSFLTTQLAIAGTPA